jgi:hypothetical protein
LYALLLRKELWECSGPAVDDKVLTSFGGVEWAFGKHMLDGLYWLAALAGHLFWRVRGVETLGIFPGEGVSCDEAVQCGVRESRELNFVFMVSVAFYGFRLASLCV